MHRNLLCVAALAAVSVIQAPAAVSSVQPVTSSNWFQELLEWPLSFLFPQSAPSELTLQDPIAPAAPVLPCQVQPLHEITDADALEFESHKGSAGVVNTSGMTPAAAMALNHFQSLVSSFGGSVTVKSAYRPQAYQNHLQEVWDKWMTELRNNTAPECSELRSAVYAEFSGHDLLESQRPAGISDHSRGTAFDAAVYLPERSARAKRKINVDTLARRVGLFRPVAFQDPVHFRLGLGRLLAAAGRGRNGLRSSRRAA